MPNSKVFAILMLVAAFLLIGGLCLLILMPVFGLLYFAALALLFTILWFAVGRFREVIEDGLISKLRGIRAMMKAKSAQTGTQEYDNEFHIRYELIDQATRKHTPINSVEFTLGRKSSCQLVINDPTISREHCRITYRKYSHEYYIEDLRSRSGTYLGVRRLEPNTQEKLLDQSEITISNHTYRFEKIV